VIVDQDPLAMDPENLLQLQVLETISRGKTVFLAP
jgi:predicted amidohydrolase YtcJ